MNKISKFRYSKIQTRGVLLAGLLLLAVVADASAAGSRGGRGGGGGGRMAQSSVSAGNHSASRASAGNNAASRSQGTSANRNNANTGNSRNNVNSGNSVNAGNRVNTGDINIDRGDVNIDVDGGYGGYHGGYYRHPVAAGAVIGAMAVTTAAVMGSYYYALPPTGCAMVVTNGITYQRCGSVYYQQTMSGNDVVYVVVNP